MKDLLIFTKIAYQWAGKRLFFLLGFMILAALLEGLGISLFLPILLGVEDKNQANQYLGSAFKNIDLSFSIPTILMLMVIFFVLKSAFMVLQGTYTGKIVSEFLIDLRYKTTQKIFETDYQYLSKQNTGYLVNAIAKEFEGVMFVFRMYASILVKVIFSAMYIAIPLVINFSVTATLLLCGIPAFFFIRKINLKTKDYSLRQSAQSAQLQSLLMQALTYLKYLKATHSQEPVLKKIKTETHGLSHIIHRTNILGCITQYAFEPIAILALAGLIFYHVEIQGKPVLEIAFLVYLIRRGSTSLLSIQQAYRKFLSAIGNVYVFRKLESELSQHHQPPLLQAKSPNFSGPITFADVSFSYNGNQATLNKLNFCIPPQTTVAFVGDSGAGKSTLVNLLTGILKPTTGQITLNQIPLNDIDTILYRKNIGYITQENVVFNASIQDNISLWNEKLDPDKVINAAKQAHIHEFIESLPQGYHTILGEGGINISGGQRQRIMIARELYKQAQLLIFDEATSALDSHSEKEIQSHIDAFQGQKTVVIIAHRLSTIQNCDIIFVIKNGHIIEQGTYDTLYRQNGEFTQMVDKQSQSNIPSSLSPSLLG